MYKMADKRSEKEEKPIVVAKNAAELQKIRLEKLMNNPAKPVYIPEKCKDYKPREPLEFIRNIWGSSAGAGSGDFHVYRGVRRREYARQKFRKEKEEKEEADETYQKKIENNQKAAEERTAKKRAKRLKKKQKQKNKKPKKEEKETSDEEEEEESDTEDVNKGDNRVGEISSNGDNSKDIQTEIKTEETDDIDEKITGNCNTNGEINCDSKQEIDDAS